MLGDQERIVVQVGFAWQHGVSWGLALSRAAGGRMKGVCSGWAEKPKRKTSLVLSLPPSVCLC